MTDYAAAGSSLDLMDFSTVRDGGIVETPTTYAMLVRVQPRDWLILSEQHKENTYLSFITYLRGLHFPTQILSMTTAYNLDPYLGRFDSVETPLIGPAEDVAAGGDALDESPLLEYGRRYHADWLRNVVEVAEVRDREFYVAVSVAKQEDADDGLAAQLRSVLPGGDAAVDVDIEDERAFIEEVQARAQRVASKLPQTGVKTEILDTRPAVLEVLYEVYHGEKPPISFTQGTFTRAGHGAQSVADAAYVPEEAAAAEANEDGGFDFERVSDRSPDPEPAPDAKLLAPVGDGGYAHPTLVARVSNSRILRWYARNIGPVGHGPRPVIPRSIYAGVFLGLLSVLLGVGALGTFIWSMEAAQAGNELYWLPRMASFAAGMASLPGFLLSIVVLFPSGRLSKGLGLASVAITTYAISLFLQAYPDEWDFSNPAQTMLTVEVYAAGLSVLLIAVILAVRSRQKLDLSTLETAPGTGVVTDGGKTTGASNDTESGLAPPAHSPPGDAASDADERD